MTALLALDFDGVICDALLECAAIIWYSVPGRDPGGQVPMRALVDRVPQSFLELFTVVRNHSRTLEDFTAAVSPHAGSIQDQAGFAAVLAGMSPAARSSLAARAARIRSYWRASDRSAWLDLHRVHPPVAEAIRSRDDGVAVVTAKDEASVREILAHHGLDKHV